MHRMHFPVRTEFLGDPIESEIIMIVFDDGMFGDVVFHQKGFSFGSVRGGAAVSVKDVLELSEVEEKRVGADGSKSDAKTNPVEIVVFNSKRGSLRDMGVERDELEVVLRSRDRQIRKEVSKSFHFVRMVVMCWWWW